MEKKGFFDGSIGQYLLPGIILQSVLIGGGYATGREIVEYGAKFGALGWLSGFATFLGFAIVCSLSFELIRLFKAYDFKSFIKLIAGPLCYVFDIIYFLFMIIIIAVMSSATGSVVEETTGLNYWVGVTAITVIVGLLNFYGEHLIEHFETLGTILLYIGYIMFSVLVISTHYDNIGTVFANNDSSFVAGATAFDSIWNGIIYMAFNLVVLPASFFTIKRQTSRKQSIISGIIGGILMTIPWFLTYFSVMGFYPSDKVLSAPVPWVVMMQSCNAGSFMYIFFGLVMGWTLIETATGIIHAMLTRIDKSLEERNGGQLSRTQKGGLTIGILIASMGMAQIGIIDLIAKGYNALAYAFIAIFLIPLFTVGVYKIHQKRKEELAALAVVNSEEK